VTNADFSLWQDSENSWGVRLKAQPFRTDLNLNDIGLLQVNGTWQRADNLRDTPLQFNLEWNGAQLGQLTKFFTGNDQGWRGEVLLDMTLAGTPAKLQIASNGAIRDFRRFDITSGRALRLAGHCDGKYSSTSHSFHGLLCSSPVGTGLITLQGDMGLPGSHSYALTLTAENVPVGAVSVLVARAKKNLPEDLVAGGILHGSLSINENASAAPKLRFDGQGEIADFRFASVSSKAEIGPETIPFLLTTGDSSVRKAMTRKSAPNLRFPEGPHVEFGPFPVAIGRAAPIVRGWVNRSGYKLAIAGEAEIAQTLRAARMFGLAALQTTSEGTAQVDLQIAGSWAGRSNGIAAGFAVPQVTGTAKLRNVRVALRGVGTPVEIVSADMQLLPAEARVTKLNAKAADTSWTGSLEMPRGCGTPSACEVHFILNANQLDLGALRDWVSPSPKARPWYRVLESNALSGPSLLSSVRAVGQLTADRFQLQNLTATRVSAKVRLDSAKLNISGLSGDLLGGVHRGEWQADFTVKPAICKGGGRFTGISLARLADAMKDAWIAGTANASYEMNGPCPAEFWTSAEGTLQFDMKDGSLRHVTLTDDAEALKVTRLTGQVRLQAGTIEMNGAELDAPGGKFELSGTASLEGALDFNLGRIDRRAAARYTITGTFAKPHVNQSETSETQARLKTDPPK
jgi:hypothetical protein